MVLNLVGKIFILFKKTSKQSSNIKCIFIQYTRLHCTSSIEQSLIEPCIPVVTNPETPHALVNWQPVRCIPYNYGQQINCLFVLLFQEASLVQKMIVSTDENGLNLKLICQGLTTGLISIRYTCRQKNTRAFNIITRVNHGSTGGCL